MFVKELLSRLRIATEMSYNTSGLNLFRSIFQIYQADYEGIWYPMYSSEDNPLIFSGTQFPE